MIMTVWMDEEFNYGSMSGVIINIFLDGWNLLISVVIRRNERSGMESAFWGDLHFISGPNLGPDSGWVKFCMDQLRVSL